MDPKDLIHLMTFVQVVNTGNFTAAAKRLDLPCSSVSQQIRALEKSVGTGKLTFQSPKSLGISQ